MFDPDDNLVQPFQLESSHLRGRFARIGSVLDLILGQHAYPPSVAALLAEAIVIATVLASSLKYDGIFTLQTKSDGAIRLAVADVTSDGGLRAYAQFDKDKLTAGPLLGKGHLAFTCALAGQDDRYQGIVALEPGSLAASVQHYFRQSEQIPTGIISAVRQDENNRWRGGCLLLQKMPREGGVNVESTAPDAEDWTRAMMVMETCTPEELTSSTLPPQDLLFRLFHEEGVRVYDIQKLRHQCRCSDQRVEAMLRALPRAEIEQLAVDGTVTVTCEFCNKSYIFDQKRRAALFAGKAGT